jgi:hypothetical protein
MINSTHRLPAIIAGPLLRHINCHELTFWLVTTDNYPLHFYLYQHNNGQLLLSRLLSDTELQRVPIGKHAVINLIHIRFENSLPENTILSYDFELIFTDKKQTLNELIPELTYPGNQRPTFAIKSNIQKILHGSCRKPHFASDDGLKQVDKALEGAHASVTQRPSLLMMTGDQVYVDDVAGPMLVAIHQVIELLGLCDESWQGAKVGSSEELFSSQYCYYHRDKLLPHQAGNKAIYENLFGGSKKPIFTSVNAKNHLVSLSEILAMYLLVWSPSLWSLVKLEEHSVDKDFYPLYQQECIIINEFVAGLSEVRRGLAHIPTYMIFDDHDITDDWNLTRAWEEAAYGHPFSKQIIGNALIAYWLCQGWGNTPDTFQQLNQKMANHFTPQGVEQQMALIDELLAWQQWHFCLATSPKIVVLDTRTQRWRSENKASKPSGLMDWEALSELQQELIDQPSVIMVSPAPIYGVKLIETIQRIFTFFGQPLMVDAENWMAHKGTANVMLNIFRHVKTPPNFIILSGDVHYSFVYEVSHRFRRHSSTIYQITSSGIKNQFPAGLLQWLGTINRVLYSPYSPLNWLTQRRRMKIKERKPSQPSHSALYNRSGIGQLTLTDDGEKVQVDILTVDNKTISFD